MISIAYGKIVQVSQPVHISKSRRIDTWHDSNDEGTVVIPFPHVINVMVLPFPPPVNGGRDQLHKWIFESSQAKDFPNI